MEDLMKTIGEQLKEAREKQGISQKVMMIRTGIAQKTISRIENGVDNTKMSTIIKMAEALDMKIVMVSNERYLQLANEAEK